MVQPKVGRASLIQSANLAHEIRNKFPFEEMGNKFLWAAEIYQEQQVPQPCLLFLSHYTAGPFKGQGRRHSHCLVANVSLASPGEANVRNGSGQALKECLGQSSGVAGTDENFSLKLGEYFLSYYLLQYYKSCCLDKAQRG